MKLIIMLMVIIKLVILLQSKKIVLSINGLEIKLLQLLMIMLLQKEQEKLSSKVISKRQFNINIMVLFGLHGLNMKI